MGKKYTCKEAVKWLKSGNKKHVKECKSGIKTFELESAGDKQRPIVAILSCADSRVIPEHIFGAREGELFTVRVAGNVASQDVIASLEYAVAELFVPVIVVMGHERCGAVEAAIKFVKKRENLGHNLNNLISYIIPAVNDPQTNDLPTAICRNAINSADDLLERSNILLDAFYRKKDPLLITAAYYHLDTGKVEWLDGCKC
jgi:carbonic anhydrase